MVRRNSNLRHFLKKIKFIINIKLHKKPPAKQKVFCNAMSA